MNSWDGKGCLLDFLQMMVKCENELFGKDELCLLDFGLGVCVFWLNLQVLFFGC